MGVSSSRLRMTLPTAADTIGVVRVHDFLKAHGGSARWARIRTEFSQRELEAALRDGEIVRASRGMYSVPRVTPYQDAKRLNGVVSHYTAAMLHDMGAIRVQEHVDITVDPHRGSMRPPPHVRIRYSDVPPEEAEHRVTMPLRTAVDCARTYPFSTGLTIAETAVLQGKVDFDDFRAAVGRLRGRGSAAARRVAQAIDLSPQRPIESYLRGLLLQAGITCFQPQFLVIVDGEKIATTDLGDPSTKTLIEVVDLAGQQGRRRRADDALRCNVLVAHGYAVLRVADEHVLDDTERVIELVRTTLHHRATLCCDRS
jgi:hypothetical protein